jgi:2-polyprenyl-3-methyl-5-hydroxy-6-metoxy-1,4-benzoquinol methylase
MKTISQDNYNTFYYINSCDGYNESGKLPDRLVSLLKYLSSGLSVLDIGCGRGEIAKALTDRFVISIDYSLASMALFHKNNDINSINRTYIRHDVSNGLAWLSSDFFDTIILADIIEHVYDDTLSILASESVRLLKKGGLILIDTPISTRESFLHVNIKKSVQCVVDVFKGTELVISEWYKEPEHCHIILRKI